MVNEGIKITKAMLAEIYNNNTNKNAARLLGISELSLIKLVREYNIKPKGSGNRTIRSKKVIVNDN